MRADIYLRDSGDRSSAPVEVTVDRGPADTELRRNLRDGVQPAPVRAGLLVHPPGKFRPPRSELRFCPPVHPRARAAARPSIVRSDIRACSNSAIEPRIWKNIRPMTVEVSMPWSSTTRSTLCSCRSLDKAIRCSRDRPSRSSFVTTSRSPARFADSSALSSPGRGPACRRLCRRRPGRSRPRSGRRAGRRGSDPGSIHVRSRSSPRIRNANARERDIEADTRATRNPATRQRRVEVSISKMDRGKRRPCCFDLTSCPDPDLARSGKLREPS